MPAKVDLVAGSSGVAARDMNRGPIWETRAKQKTRDRTALAIEWLALIAGGRSPTRTDETHAVHLAEPNIVLAPALHQAQGLVFVLLRSE
jgi:hypothetical protein